MSFLRKRESRIMEIYLLRHGESTSDVEERYGGDYDDHLTDKGVAQAQDLASKLTDKGIEVIFCSPLHRAVETGEVLARNLGCPLSVIDDLRERNAYGVLTGMVKSQAAEEHPDMVQALKAYRNTIEGAETYEDFKQRISQVFAKLVAAPHASIAILTHGGPIRCLCREVLKVGELAALGDCAIMELVGEGESCKIVRMDGAALGS